MAICAFGQTHLPLRLLCCHTLAQLEPSTAGLHGFAHTDRGTRHCQLHCRPATLALHEGSPVCMLQAHGCLLQATALLELNGHTVHSSSLFRAVLPALQACLHLMSPKSPCAPLRNQITLLAAAALGLPNLAATPSVKAFADEVATLCWHAISTDSSKHSSSTSSSSSDTQLNTRTCDDADPMHSLWLKHVALLFFGSKLAQARAENSSGGDNLRAGQVQAALGSNNYDVRAACLKALVRRGCAGEG